MAKEKLEDLSLDRLRKRKRLGVAVLCILIGAAILNIILILVDFIGEKQLDFRLLGGAAGCLVVVLPVYLGIKKLMKSFLDAKASNFIQSKPG